MAMRPQEKPWYDRFWNWITRKAESPNASPGVQAQARQGRTGSSNVNADPNSVQTDPSKDPPSTVSSQDPTRAKPEPIRRRIDP